MRSPAAGTSTPARRSRRATCAADLDDSGVLGAGCVYRDRSGVAAAGRRPCRPDVSAWRAGRPSDVTAVDDGVLAWLARRRSSRGRAGTSSDAARARRSSAPGSCASVPNRLRVVDSRRARFSTGGAVAARYARRRSPRCAWRSSGWPTRAARSAIASSSAPRRWPAGRRRTRRLLPLGAARRERARAGGRAERGAAGSARQHDRRRAAAGAGRARAAQHDPAGLHGGRPAGGRGGAGDAEHAGGGRAAAADRHPARARLYRPRRLAGLLVESAVVSLLGAGLGVGVGLFVAQNTVAFLEPA